MLAGEPADCAVPVRRRRDSAAFFGFTRTAMQRGMAASLMSNAQPPDGLKSNLEPPSDLKSNLEPPNGKK